MKDKENQMNRTDNFEELSDTVSIPNKEKTISISKFEDIKLTIPFKKEVEEMAKELKELADIVRTILKERTDIKYIPDLAFPIAKELLKHYQPKLPEDSVVLSREEYESLKGLYDTQKGAIMTSSIGDLPLTVEGLRKAIDEITRLNSVETELQELNAKYYNEAKDLRREVNRLKAHAKINDEHLHIRIKNQASEETAEKIYYKAEKKAYYQDGGYYDKDRYYLDMEDLKEIIRSCGVEIKEN